MSSAYPSFLMLRDLKKSDCLRSTQDFINCKLGGKGCRNLDEISKRVCDKDSNLRDIIIVKDDYGNVVARDRTDSYVRHSER